MNALLQWLEDEEKKLVAQVSAFFAGLKSHPAVAAPAAEAPATAQPVPVPPAVAVPAPVQQSTDATAPGFVAPVEPTPAPAPVAPAEPLPALASTMTWDDFQKLNTVPVVGNFSLTLTECPGSVRVMTVARSGYPTANEYSLTVNGVKKDWTSPIATCVIPAEGPKVDISIAQPADSNLSMQVQG